LTAESDLGSWERPMSRRQFVRAAGAGGCLLLAPSLAGAARAASLRPALSAALLGDNIVLRWNEAALEGVRQSALGPPMVSRALAVVHTAIFDAWAAYDPQAVGTRLGGSLRRPARERSLTNKETAISFAAYRAAVDLFPGSKASVFDPLMASLGYDPSDQSHDTSTPTGIGNVTAKALLDFRHADGSNQLGNVPGGTPGVPYSDYTGYVPANLPMDTRFPLALSTVNDPNRWQPLRWINLNGDLVTPSFIGPQWQNVTPFGLTSGSQLRGGPAAEYGSNEYVQQATDLLELTAALTDKEKMIAEYWADGPRSELPPGHWDLFAQFVSRRDHHRGEHGTDADVKMFFALTNAIMDAGICCWDMKRHWDYVRPVTAIRYLFFGRLVRAWGGPYQGTKTIPGETWLPYQPTWFVTPPFSEYTSGHSTFSAAGAEILKRFTHKDRFGYSVTLPAGSSRTEPGAVPAEDVTLSWATFSEAADEAGISRRLGGIHFEQGDVEARASGRLVGAQAWEKAASYWTGR
jgi:hypothetical protein